MTSIENEITEVAEGKYGSFAQREPALLTGLIAAPVGGVLTGLAERGVITDADASTLTSVVVGAVVALAIAAQSAVIRRFVVPAWKHYTTRPRPNLGVGPVVDEPADSAEQPEPAVAPLITGTAAPVQTPHHPMPGPGQPDVEIS